MIRSPGLQGFRHGAVPSFSAWMIRSANCWWYSSARSRAFAIRAPPRCRPLRPRGRRPSRPAPPATAPRWAGRSETARRPPRRTAPGSPPESGPAPPRPCLHAPSAVHLLVCRRLHSAGVRSPRLTDQHAAVRAPQRRHVMRRRSTSSGASHPNRAARAACSSTTYRSHAVQHAISSNRRWAASVQKTKPAAGPLSALAGTGRHLTAFAFGHVSASMRIAMTASTLMAPYQRSPIALLAAARPVRRPSGSRLRRSLGRGPSARRAAPLRFAGACRRR